jgi:phage shock protein C
MAATKRILLVTDPGQRLHRSGSDRMIAGVCGGLAAYFAVDVTVVRLVWAVVTVLTGVIPGSLVYLLFVIVVPVGRAGEVGQGTDENRPALAGLLLILVGALLLLGNFGLFHWLSWGRLWPVLLILVGVALLVRK